jgi:3-methylcrotonyl-CoA carboxylase alpha subunit
MTPEQLIAAAVEEPLIAAFGALVLGAGAGPDPWQASGPWRTGGAAHFDVQHDGTVHSVNGQRLPGGSGWTVRVGDREHTVRFTLAGADRILSEIDGLTRGARVIRVRDGIDVVSRDQAYTFRWSAGAPSQAHEAHKGRGLTSPMPGLILRVLVKAGDRVKAHQTLLVLEAMKMEHNIEAPHDGIVKKVHCVEGGRVAEGVLLIELEAEAAPS